MQIGNKGPGVRIAGNATSNTIGGTAVAERNHIDGNAVGIDIESNQNTVIGNYIGVGRNGQGGFKGGNGVGVSVLGKDNIIGGFAISLKANVSETPANVISWNGLGIQLVGATGTKIYGNFIGTNAAGTEKWGNGTQGISVSFSDNNFIGGPQVGLRNVISGNKQQGILFENSTGNRMENNNIGFGANRALFSLVNLGNGSHGIQFDANSKNNIRKNTYAAFNAGSSYKNDGGATNKQLDPNSDHSNAYGIDNGSSVGMPVLSSATVSGTTITITGTVTHEASSQYTLEFFGNEVAERQGKRFLGDTTLTTDSGGFASFRLTFNAIYGSWVTATSTGLDLATGFTSEFANDVAISGLSTTAAVGDRVWFDTNGNGLQDMGESGVGGVLVELFTSRGVLVASMLTGVDGSYLFTGLSPGDYYLRFTPPRGYDFTLPYLGDAIFDSDADPLTGETAIFTLIAGQVDPTFDAGLTAPR